MNRFRPPLLMLALCFCTSQSGSAQVYTNGLVGYVNLIFTPGDHLIGNPLSSRSNNVLSAVFTRNGNVPDNTTFSPWDSTEGQYLPASTYHIGLGWDIDYSFPPGEGALLRAPTGLTNTFLGIVLTGTGPDEINLPIPPERGPGYYLLSSLFPAQNRTFRDIIGRNPYEGEFIVILDSFSQSYSTNRYQNGIWEGGIPYLDIGEAAFFNLIEVPEPTIVSLASLGLVGSIIIRCLGSKSR